MERLTSFHVQTPTGHRNYSAESADHAIEQHEDAFSDELEDGEKVLHVHPLDECTELLSES